jgi:antitoxin MazE
MQTTIQKWGNSLALRLPKAYTEETDIHEGSSVDLHLKTGTLVITPSRKKVHHLKDLLKKVTPRNKHASSDTGLSLGQESW